MTNLYNAIRHRIKEIIIFALIFTVIGHYLPDIYLRYFDNRDYYQVKDFKIIDTDIKRCDTVHIQFIRTALTDLEIGRKVDLIRINGNGEQQVYTYELTRDYAKDGTIEVETTKVIPCDLRHLGVYKFRFFITFSIFDKGRIYIFESPQFEIKS